MSADGNSLPVGFREGLGPASITRDSLAALRAQTQRVYLADARPWVIGFSGGKDSTVIAQLVWQALSELPRTSLTKPVYIISSDTQVESPLIVSRIEYSLARMKQAAEQQGLPMHTDLVRPKGEDTFWVNLIGKGYPAPYKRFRWCTDRLKIQPANTFIMEKVARFGEVVLVLGVRRAESATRAQAMSLHKRHGESLSRHSDLSSAWVYTPIEDWTVGDVWTYLLSTPSPWGDSNRELVTVYRNANAGECPLVVDKNTESCGSSRFGCWTCTVVERDRSMEALIENGEEWMEPMLVFRDWLASTQEVTGKHRIRDLRRRDGQVHFWGDDDSPKKVIWGPYKFTFRQEILRRLLHAQKDVREIRGDGFALISMNELEEIRRLWRTELSDWEDMVPAVWHEVTQSPYSWMQDDLTSATGAEATLLDAVAKEHGVNPQLVASLIDIERRASGMHRRAGIYKQIETCLRRDWRSEEEIRADLTTKHVNVSADDDAAEAN